MPVDSLARVLIVVGLAIVALGGLLLVLGRIPGLGRLPGDILIQRDNITIWIPLTTMILLSLLLSAAFYIAGLLFRR